MSKRVVGVLEEWGSPFLEQGKELYVLNSKDVVDESVVKTMKNLEKFGIDLCATFLSERFEERSSNIMDPIKRNNLPVFYQAKNMFKDKVTCHITEE